MQIVTLFNSTSDLALAANRAPFLPPARLRAMENDLALLPALLASEAGEPPLCLTFDALDRAARRGGRTRALRLLEPKEPGGVPRQEEVDVDLRHCLLHPWGWNRDVRLRALRAHLPEWAPAEANVPPYLIYGCHPATGCQRLIPSEEQLDAWRRLSHRGAWLPLTLPPHPLRRPIRKALLAAQSDLLALSARWPDAIGLILKRPYSCSGRGLLALPPLSSDKASTLPQLPPHVERWMADGFRLQGSLVAEECMPKAADLAMLFQAGFYSSPGGRLRYRVRPAGLSLFSTDARGAYCGNLLLPDYLIADRLRQQFQLPASLLTDTARSLARLLQQQLAPAAYCGPIGVDQLVARTAAGFRLCPVVEVNLRHTMGFVAHALAARLAPALPPNNLSATAPIPFFAVEPCTAPLQEGASPSARLLLPSLPQASFRAVLRRL